MKPPHPECPVELDDELYPDWIAELPVEDNSSMGRHIEHGDLEIIRYVSNDFKVLFNIWYLADEVVACSSMDEVEIRLAAAGYRLLKDDKHRKTQLGCTAWEVRWWATKIR